MKKVYAHHIRPVDKHFQVRALGEGKIRIEGYFNFFEPDSYGTRFDPKTVKLDRFMKNGMLLFNHDTNFPCGKVTKVEAREDGMWCEAELSSSDHEKIRFVRDLVEEGCLQTFSFRFAEEADYEKDPENPGKSIVKNWELLEVSIVSLPAQADSTFSLRFCRGLFDKVISLEQAREAVMQVRGAKVAKYVEDKIKSVVASGSIERESLMERLRDSSGIESGEFSKILEGEVTPVPDSFIGACVEILGCEKNMIEELNAADIEDDKKMAESPADVPPPEGEETEEQRAAARNDEAVQACVSEKIPVLLKEGKTQEEAVAIAIDMCSVERGCKGWRPNQDALARFLEIAADTRQADQEAGPTTPIVSELPNDNATLNKLDSMIALLGNLVTQQKEILKAFQEMAKMEVAEGSEVEMVKPDTKMSEDPKEETDPETDPETERAIQEYFGRVEARLQTLAM